MKIIITTFVILLLGASGYMYLVPVVGTKAVTTGTIVSSDDTEFGDAIDIPSVPIGNQCNEGVCAPVTEITLPRETAITENVAPVATLAAGKPSSTSAHPRYIDFVDPSGYVNTEPFMLADYIGKKIILVEFVTYSCINCQRTFPYLQRWYETYEKDGLLVVGIHTPEFAYERDRNNVIAAMKKEGITFPVVMDNEYKTWNAYANRFWPHRYVIDYEGNVVFDHVGEGAYSETEAIITQLLRLP